MNEIVRQEHRLPAINLERALPTPDFIEHWCPAYGTDQIEEARKALPGFEKSLLPMDRERIKVLFTIWSLPFKVSENLSDLETANLAKIYVAAFEDMPGDLVEPAMKHVALHFKWGFPKPADYGDCVADEWNRRKRTVNSLRAYISYHEMKERRRDNTPALVGANG